MQLFLVFSSSAVSRKNLRTSSKKFSGTGRAAADKSRRYVRSPFVFRLPSSETLAKARVADCRGRAQASRRHFRTYISTTFIRGCAVLGGLELAFPQTWEAFFHLITGVLKNEYQSYLISMQAVRLSDTLPLIFESYKLAREMLAAPSCLCMCGAGLARIGRTRGAAWARASKISASCCASRSLRAPHGRSRAGERRPLRRHVSPVQQHLYAVRAGIRLR